MGKALYSLKGATVTVPAGWTASAGYGEYQLLGTYTTNSDAPLNFYKTDLNFRIGYSAVTDFVPYENYVTPTYTSTSNAGYTSIGISNNYDLEINITGGKDVQNQSLIQWFLDNNATIEGGIWLEEGFKFKNPLTLMLGEPMSTKFYDYDLRVNAETVEVVEEATIPTDLTGYSVTVPSGWSAESGFGQFDINCSYLDVDYSRFDIGYNNLSSFLNCINFYSSSSYRSINLNTSFVIFISGGDDVTNQSLIQWFVDNGATFEYTGGSN